MQSERGGVSENLLRAVSELSAQQVRAILLTEAQNSDQILCKSLLNTLFNVIRVGSLHPDQELKELIAKNRTRCFWAIDTQQTTPAKEIRERSVWLAKKPRLVLALAKCITHAS